MTDDTAEIDKAFYDLTVAQRNHAWQQNALMETMLENMGDDLEEMREIIREARKLVPMRPKTMAWHRRATRWTTRLS